MSTSTPPSAPPGGEAESTLPDAALEESDLARANATTLEEDFLLQTFGVSIPRGAIEDMHSYAERLSHDVALRVVTIIDGTRRDVDAKLHQIEHALTPNLETRLASTLIDTSGHGAGRVDTPHALRVRAVAESIRETLTHDEMLDVIRYGTPAFVPMDPERDEHIVVLEGVELTSKHPKTGVALNPCTVSIDTRVDFWRKTEPKDLQKNLGDQIKAKRTIKALGIHILTKPPLPESFVLEPADAKQIITTGFAKGIDLERRYEVVQGRETIPGSPVNPVHYSVDTGKLVRYVAKGKRIGEINNAADLENALFDTPASCFVTTEPHTIPDPTHRRLLLRAVAVRLIADNIIPAVGNHHLERIQMEVHEQHRFFENMRKGSDNLWSAALATKLVMEHKDLRDQLITRDKTAIEADIKKERDNLMCLQFVVDLEAMTPPSGGGTWNKQLLKKSDIGKGRTTVSALPAVYVKGHTLVIGAGPLKEEYKILEDKSTPGKFDIAGAQQWLDDKEEEIDRIELEYQSLAGKFKAIINQLKTVKGIKSGLLLHSYFNVALVEDKSAFAANMDFRAIADDLRVQVGLAGKDRTAVTKDLAKYHKELEAGGAKPITGADAQHNVITAELVRYHGLTDNEAHETANVVRARALLDTDTRKMTDSATEVHFGHDAHPTTGQKIGTIAENVQRLDIFSGLTFNNSYDPRNWSIGSRDDEVINAIAHECHIPASSRKGSRPLWSQAESYEDLLTAYHALKKVRHKKYYDRTSEVPWDLRVRATARLDQDVQEITRSLFLFHAKALLEKYGPSLKIDDEKQKEILKEPTKAEHQQILMKVIESEATPEIASRVHHAIEHADHHIQPVRRFVSSTVFGKDWGLITGGKLPFSYRALIYGNPTWSLKGGLNTLKRIAHSVKNNKKAFLWGALATFLTGGNLAAGGVVTAYNYKTPPPAVTASDHGTGASPGHH